MAADSTTRYWPFLARFAKAEQEWAGRVAAHGPLAVFLYEFVRFGVKQAWACLFGAIILGMLVITHFWYPSWAGIARYDLLFLAAVAIQIVLVATRMETLDEAKVIAVFHVVAMAMEIFKISVGSWMYPEPSLFRIFNVPLFAGFMYAAIGSYIARAWRLFDFRFSHHPPLWATLLLSIGIYANFFSHHFMVDLRLVLFAMTALLFGRTTINFRVWKLHRRMPLLLGFGLVALFIWFAENLGTLTNGWLYPAQAKGWNLVPLAKLGSWFLLMIISYTLVSMINRNDTKRTTMS